MKYGTFPAIQHPAFSLHSAPSGLYLFDSIKAMLKGPSFQNAGELAEGVRDVTSSGPANWIRVSDGRLRGFTELYGERVG
jgi:hypothetical protein